MMAVYLSEFRELWGEILRPESRFVAPLLRDWAARHAAILGPYRKFQQLNALDNSYQFAPDELHSFYALSRICDVLVLPFQRGECWFDLSVEQFADFWQTLGVAASQPRDYHPFWCEIVACENGDDDDAPPQIQEIFWPALLWGELLICRAGVRLKAGKNWLNADVAASSPLYFASRRFYRARHDLSDGWGGNSQWRTTFRRDYPWNGNYVFNADGALSHQAAPFLANLSAHEWMELLKLPRRFFASRNGDNGDLTLAEREELLVNRCFVRAVKEDTNDFWPYHDIAVWRG